jgi:hypothetical protein
MKQTLEDGMWLASNMVKKPGDPKEVDPLSNITYGKAAHLDALKTHHVRFIPIPKRGPWIE